MKQKQYDAALSEIVNTIESTLESNLGPRTHGASAARLRRRP